MMESRSHPAAGRPKRREPGISRRGMVAGLLVLLVAGVCIRLGFWQLDRLEQRRERNAVLQEARALPPLELSAQALEAVRRDPDRFQFRRVRVRGEYLPRAEVVQRGRSLQGQPGVHLLTPLRVSGSRWSVLVDRGWTPSPDALSVDPRPLAEPGARSVEGIIQVFPPSARETRPLVREVGDARVTSVQRLDSAVIRRQLSTPLLPFYVQQLPGPGGPEGLHRVPPPEVGEGSHLGYAIQWFSFAAIALVGFVVLLIRSRSTLL